MISLMIVIPIKPTILGCRFLGVLDISGGLLLVCRGEKAV